MTDGSCQGYIGFLADAQADARLAAVREALGAQGWTAVAPAEPRATYVKDGRTWR